MSVDIKKALISAIATIIAALIGLYGVHMQIQNSKLQNENIALQEENSQLQSGTQESNAKVAIVEDENSILLEQIEKLEGEISELRENEHTQQEQVTQEQNEGTDNTENNTLFVSACPPYQSDGYDAPDYFIMMGESYLHGFTLRCWDCAYALFNLKNKYDTLDFDFGRVEGAGSNSKGVYTIYLDNEYIQTIEGYPDMIVKHYSIPLNHATQLKIDGDYGSGYGWGAYGFANAIIR